MLPTCYGRPVHCFVPRIVHVFVSENSKQTEAKLFVDIKILALVVIF